MVLAEDSYIEAYGAFPASNSLAYVNNGKTNPMRISLKNTGTDEISVKSISASFHDVEKGWKLLKNATTTAMTGKVESGKNTTVPFSFYSEYKPGEVGLTVQVSYLTPSQQLRHATAFNSTVTIVETPGSFFDPALIFLYLILAGFTYLVGLGIWRSFNLSTTFGLTPPKSKKKRVPREPLVKGDSAGGIVEVKGYEEDWIPPHLLSPAKSVKKSRSAKSLGASSGGEEASSGGEGKAKKTTKGKKK